MTPAGAPAAVGSLAEGFAASVRALPGRIAVRDGLRSLTYRQLDARAAEMAAALRGHRPGPRRPVGVLLERSADMVAAALAVLRTGAPCLPLDPATPRARLEPLLRAARPSVVITAGAPAARLPAGPAVLRTDTDLPPGDCLNGPDADAPPGLHVPPRTGPHPGSPNGLHADPHADCPPGPYAVPDRDTPAYTLFPPGAAGRARPVQLSHGSVLELFAGAGNRHGFCSEDVWALSHSVALDVFVREMWGALLYGGCAVVVPRNTADDPRALLALLRSERVTVLHQSPAALRRLLAEDARAGGRRLPLRCVVLDGGHPRDGGLAPWRAAYGEAVPRLVTLDGDGAQAPGSAPFALVGAEDRERLTAGGGIEDAYPVGAVQARLFLRSAYRPATDPACDLFVFRLGAAYDHDALTRAVARAVARHDVLRTSFRFAGRSEPLQLVHRTATAPLNVRDLRGLCPGERAAEVAALAERERTEPFDWSAPPLMRCGAYLLDDGEFLLSVCFHEALLDGWSEQVLTTEILADFWALRGGRGKPAAEPPAHRPADGVARERRARNDPSVTAFWSRELAGLQPTLLPWPAAGPAGTGEEPAGLCILDLPPEESEALEEAAREHGATLDHVLLAVHARVLTALTGRDEVVLGVETDGRDADGGAGRPVGVQLNVVPYRLRTRGLGWGGLIRAVQDKERALEGVRCFPYAALGRLAGVREPTDITVACTRSRGFEELVAATELHLLDAKTRVRTGAALRVEFVQDPFTRLLTLELEADERRADDERLEAVAELYAETIAALAAEGTGT
ncbi:AMP-binding protein [Streptomyces cinnamoneus]|uniref:AMP-binding protein n=1 Tax=Streptomyces cinnamoneus TaxID=53446 RepID=UPI00343D17E9